MSPLRNHPQHRKRSLAEKRVTGPDRNQPVNSGIVALTWRHTGTQPFNCGRIIESHPVTQTELSKRGSPGAGLL